MYIGAVAVLPTCVIFLLTVCSGLSYLNFVSLAGRLLEESKSATQALREVRLASFYLVHL